MVYLKSVENVITLIGLLFLFCLPLLSILFLKTKRNDLARPVMGTIFLVVIIVPQSSTYLTTSTSANNLYTKSSFSYGKLKVNTVLLLPKHSVVLDCDRPSTTSYS